MIGFGHHTFDEMPGPGEPNPPRSLIEVAERFYGAEDEDPGDPFHLDDGEGAAAIGRSRLDIGFEGDGKPLVLKFGGDAM